MYSSTRVPVVPHFRTCAIQGAVPQAYCAFAPKWGVVLKSISTPPFSRRWEHFQKSARVVECGIAIELQPREPIFEKMFSSSRKSWVLFFFFWVCMVGCMGRISHTHFKFVWRIATSKNHIGLLVPDQIWDRFRDPDQYDLQNFRKRIFFGWRPGRFLKTDPQYPGTAGVRAMVRRTKFSTSLYTGVHSCKPRRNFKIIRYLSREVPL